MKRFLLLSFCFVSIFGMSLSAAQKKPKAVVHSVSLKWIASTTPGVNYRIYRRVSTIGNFIVVGSSTAVTYVDQTVFAGFTYSYQITAFCNSTGCPPTFQIGKESAPSSPITVTIPAGVVYPYAPSFSPPSVLSFAYTTGGVIPVAQTLNVSDSSPCPPPVGTPVCNWPATVSSDSSWLAVTPVGGTTSFPIVVSVNPAGLAVGTYTGKITATISQFATPTATLPVTLVVSQGVTPGVSMTCSWVAAAYVCSITNIPSGQKITVTATTGNVVTRSGTAP